ncbi:MAG: cysteine desulfurase [Candidatus Dojkabacteria bacterium]|nr:cysteine desulfurase [Candidatus Dojkabacteria bacterium]
MINPSIKNDFPIFSIKVNDKPLIYIDNSATSQRPKVVIDKLVEFYETYNASIHRGIHTLSEKATEAYEESRRKVANFINAKDDKEIIYTRNATESLNLVAYSWGMNYLKKGDLVLSTDLEHHSNIVPWQIVEQKIGISIKCVAVDDNFNLDLEEYKKLLKLKPKLVAVVHASNVTGTVNPVKEITSLAHEAGALVLVDAAQSAPHMRIDVQEMDCDFLALSAHKMCGPTGIGVLYGKRELLEEIPPFLTGGGMIKSVSCEKTTWNTLPDKFEAGTPNIAGSIAFGATIDYLLSIGMENIEKHEREIVSYAIPKLTKVKGLEIFGQDDTPEVRGGMIAFTMNCAHPHDISEILNEEGIAVRSGHHCAQPLHTKFKKASTTRASFYFYNQKEDVDKLAEALEKVIKLFA